MNDYRCPKCGAELYSPNAPHRGYQCGSKHVYGSQLHQTRTCRIHELEAENERLRIDNKAYLDERQQLRNILSVPIITGEGTSAAEFDARYPLVDSAKMLRATIGRLCSAGITCCESNTSEWMDHWANTMNAALETIGERDRVKRESIGFGIVDSQISIDDARKI